MPTILNAVAKLTSVVLAANVSRTATLTGTGQNCSDYDGQMMAVLTCSAGAAGTVTLDVKLQSSTVVGSGYVDIPGAVFTQVTTAASNQNLVFTVGTGGSFIRAIGTQGAGSTFVYGVELLGVKKTS